MRHEKDWKKIHSGKFLHFMSLLTQNNLKYAVMRNHQYLPYFIKNDIDILIERKATIDVIVGLLNDTGYILINKRKKFEIISFDVNDGFNSYVIDFIYSPVKNWSRYADEDLLLERSIIKENYKVLSPIDELLTIILKEVYTYSRVRKKYEKYLASTQIIIKSGEDFIPSDYWTLNHEKTLWRVQMFLSNDKRRLFEENKYRKKYRINLASFGNWLYHNRIKL